MEYNHFYFYLLRHIFRSFDVEKFGKELPYIYYDLDNTVTTPPLRRSIDNEAFYIHTELYMFPVPFNFITLGNSSTRKKMISC